MSTTYPTVIHERVAQCNAGTNVKTICRVASGWVVMGDTQFLPGYCLLLADPVVKSLNELTTDQRKVYLYEMSVLGDVLLEVTGARMINYAMLGNLEPALHAHLFPRFEDEPEELRYRPAWFYEKTHRASIVFEEKRDRPLMDKIKAGLEARSLVVSK